VRVVVGDVLAQNSLELFARNDQNAVETFTPDAADPSLRARLRPRRGDRRLDQPESLRPEDLVECGREFAVEEDPAGMRVPAAPYRGSAVTLLLALKSAADHSPELALPALEALDREITAHRREDVGNQR
jgi:hypothetical protein